VVNGEGLDQRRRLRRIAIAVAASGLAVFTLLYAPQPVLPQLAADFAIRAGQASLAISVATGALALSVLPAAALSEVVGRRPVMVVGVLAAAFLGLLVPLAPTYPILLVLRALQGLAVAGPPAVAMAYLAEEVGPGGVGAAIGALVAGNSLGGMLGRLLVGVAGGSSGWRLGVASAGAFGAVTALVFAILLPPSVSRVRRAGSRSVLHGLGAAVTDPLLLAAYAIAALLMGCFVALYNVISFRLASPPLSLPPTLASLVFAAYAVGTGTSILAGRWSDRLGRGAVLLAGIGLTLAGALLTLPHVLPSVLAGVALFTGGFFAAHSVASGWVGARARPGARGQAAGLYLLAYYLGSSVLGTLGSAIYGAWGWPALIAQIGGFLALAAAVAVAMARAASTPRNES
jgi:MFS transporter, YNFM family, putative membrane transport protein